MSKKISKKVSCRRFFTVTPIVVCLALPLAGWWAPAALAADDERYGTLDPDGVSLRGGIETVSEGHLSDHRDTRVLPGTV